MIALHLPEPLLWALRWLLLLGPLGLVMVMVRWRRIGRRGRIGGLFAFLYGLGMIQVTHALALEMGWWHYGWDILMLNGMPADILIGGAILFGPGLYFAFPGTRPLWLVLPIAVLAHGTVFRSLEPLVTAGPGWWIGVPLVFATAHVPAIYLARWTERDTHLPLRVALLALLFAGLAFVILPALIMQAMGGAWDLGGKSLLAWALVVPPMAVSWLIGLSGVQMLALQGQGTAIPLDPTRRLVTTGIYAYLCNPMQLSAALSWILLGAFLHNGWIAAASVMAWVFVQGMVRWHHRNDLAQRFPAGWTAYRLAVGEWLPRWHPHAPEPGLLVHDAASPWQGRFARLLAARTPALRTAPGRAPYYSNPADLRSFEGLAALCMALTQVNFALALVGHAGLMVALPLAAARRALVA